MGASNTKKLFQCVRNGDIQGVTELLDNGVQINSQNMYRQTPLNVATRLRKREVVRLLIERRADIHRPDTTGNTPLHVAVMKDLKDIAKLLIESKSSIDPRCRTHGFTPMILACRNDKADVAALLLDCKANTDIGDRQGLRPMHWASIRGHTGVVNTLLIGKANVDIVDSLLTTPLMYAVLNKNVSVVQTLVEALADTTLRNNMYKTAAEMIGSGKDDKLISDYLAKALTEQDRIRAEMKDRETKRQKMGVLLSKEDFSVGDKIGSGAFSDVSLLDVRGIPEKCVIKVPKMVNRYDLAKEFMYCVKIGRQRNLLRFIGLAAYKDRQCFVTEHCARGSLDKLHNKEDLISRFFHIATSLCLAVAHLHSFPKPIIHRDIACRNVLVKADWTVVLSDYGLARETGGNDYYVELTKGTILPQLWMSPEALRKKFKPAGDVWQIGVTMWEVLTKGWKPYFTDSRTIFIDELLSVAKGIREGKRELKIPEGTDAEAAAFVRACCTRDYKARPSAVRLLLDHIPDGKQAIRQYGSEQTKKNAGLANSGEGESGDAKSGGPELVDAGYADNKYSESGDVSDSSEADVSLESGDAKSGGPELVEGGYIDSKNSGSGDLSDSLEADVSLELLVVAEGGESSV